MTTEIAAGYGAPVPLGWYDGVITDIEVRQGPKGAYLNIEVTIHDEEYAGRKVWRNSSFSEKALFMPGGPAQLIQATKPDIPKDTAPDKIPYAVALAATHSPVKFEVDHEQVVKNGVAQVDPDGEPVLRATVKQFAEAEAAFADKIEAEVSGDTAKADGLPF